jgi:hypothetical protein
MTQAQKNHPRYGSDNNAGNVPKWIDSSRDECIICSITNNNRVIVKSNHKIWQYMNIEREKEST